MTRRNQDTARLHPRRVAGGARHHLTLVSLLMAGFSAVRIAQQEKATDDIVRKLQVAIETQAKELVDQAAKDRRGRTALFQSWSHTATTTRIARGAAGRT